MAVPGTLAPERRATLPIAGAVGLLPAGFALAYAALPGSRDWLTREDGIIEWTAAVLFLTAGYLAVVRLLRTDSHPGSSWLLPAAALIGFGEETAYGARIFGFPLPTVNGRPVDSLHDVFDIADGFLADAGIRRTHAAIAGLAALSLVVAVAHRRGWLRRAGRWVLDNEPVAFVLAAVCLSLIAVAFDLLGGTQTGRLAEELLEVTAAAVLVVGALRIGQASHDQVEGS
jgi:hypothetical protein